MGTKKMNLLQFREVIIDDLLQMNKYTVIHRHINIQSYERSVRESRKRCKEAYKHLSKKKGSNYDTNNNTKVKAHCGEYNGQPTLCLKCYNKLHRKQ